MSKHGVNVPRGVAVSSVEEVRKAIKDFFPNEKEVIHVVTWCSQKILTTVFFRIAKCYVFLLIPLIKIETLFLHVFHLETLYNVLAWDRLHMTMMTNSVNGMIVQLVVKSQILAGGRGLGTFKSGLQGGVHIVKTEQVEDLAGNACYSSNCNFLVLILCSSGLQY